MRRSRFSPHWAGKIDRLREMAAAKASAQEIATELRVTVPAVRCKAFNLSISIRPPRKPYPRRPLPTLPDVMPLVERALADDPAGATDVQVNAGAQTKSERSWPLHVAAYVLNVELGFSGRRTAPALGRSHKLIGYAVRRIEERRDEDPAFDAFLERLGDQARELAA